jgi:hypothetical protein
LSLGALGLIRAPLRTPLFVQVLGLMLLSLIAAQVVNVGIVFLIPPRRRNTIP